MIAAGATSFKMTKLKDDGSYLSGRVADGAAYGLTVFHQPDGGQVCTIDKATGTMGATDITDVAIHCH